MDNLERFGKDERHLRLHALQPFSRANGPGLRVVVWVQGCSLGCPGCYNPQTHPAAGGVLLPTSEIYAQLAAQQTLVEGVTISGGEPFDQAPALATLLYQVRIETPLSVLIFTGYEMAELARIPMAGEVLTQTDVLIAGRYRKEQRLAREMRGSTNKTVHFLTSRYTPDDLISVPEAEAWITPQGEILYSGIDPVMENIG